jgi:hypothetical protein
VGQGAVSFGDGLAQPGSARQLLPFGGRYASAIACNNFRDGMPTRRTATTSKIDARRWVGVTTFSSRLRGSGMAPCAEGASQRDEYVWVLRPGGSLPPITGYGFSCLANLLASELVYACKAGAPRFMIVGLDVLPRQLLVGPPPPWAEDIPDGDEEERRGGDEEDGVDGALCRLLRARVRWLLDIMEPNVSKREVWLATVLDNTRILTVDAYRAHLLATPGLGVRAVELELGDDALVL